MNHITAVSISIVMKTSWHFT